MISMWRANGVRWWYQREQAWWRRRQSSQCPVLPGGGLSITVPEAELGVMVLRGDAQLDGIADISARLRSLSAARLYGRDFRRTQA
jgi:hypothetical protein